MKKGKVLYLNTELVYYSKPDNIRVYMDDIIVPFPFSPLQEFIVKQNPLHVSKFMPFLQTLSLPKLVERKG